MTQDDVSEKLPLRERNKMRTRRRIVEAASRLFAEHGVAGTSIDDLARGAHVSRATFFNYFGTKSAVVRELVHGLEEDFRASARHRSAARASTADRLRGLFTDTSQRLKTQPALYRMIVGEAESGFSTPEEREMRYQRMHEALRRLLADGVARGEVRADVPVAVLAEMVAGIYVAILQNWRRVQNYPLHARLQAAAEFLVESLAPRAPRRKRSGGRR